MKLAELLAIKDAEKLLFDGDVYNAIVKDVAEFGISHERVSELLDLSDAVIEETVRGEEMPAFIQEAFGVNEDDAKKIACSVIGHRMLPLEPFIPGMKAQLIAWGGKEEQYPQRSIKKESITEDEFVRRVLDGSTLTFSEMLMKRFTFLLKGYVQGSRTAEEFRTFLGRPLPVGGMALEKEHIDAIVQEVDRQSFGIVLEVGEKPAKEVVVQKIQNSPEEDIPEEKDYLQAKKNEKLLGNGVETAFTDVIDSALAKGASLCEEHHIPSSAYASLLSKMLRGVRDQYQTRTILEQDYRLHGEPLAKIMEIFLESQEMYTTALHALKTVDPEIPTLSELRAARIEEHESHTLSHTLAPKQAKVEFTTGSVASLTTATGQRKVIDVVHTPKLMGPIEQLRSVTLADFRRMSAQPEEACEKMFALLSGLGNISEEDRIRGVFAWKESPLSRMYSELVRACLQEGVGIPEYAAKKRAQGEEIFTPNEIRALSAWNDRIRS